MLCDHATEVDVPAVAPTCTVTGLTAGTACSVCGKTMTAQQVVPVTEHTFCDWYTTKDATCCDAGREARICACGESEGRLSPATGHHFDINGVCAGCGFTKAAIAAANTAPSRTNPNTGVHF